jgi:hypothetical protein
MVVMLLNLGACNEKKANAVKIEAETFRKRKRSEEYLSLQLEFNFLLL